MHIGIYLRAFSLHKMESIELFIQLITVDTSLTLNRPVSTNQIGDPSPTCDDDVIVLYY